MRTVIGQMVEPDSLNLYNYCRGNPLKFIDPSGYCSEYDERKHVTYILYANNSPSSTPKGVINKYLSKIVGVENVEHYTFEDGAKLQIENYKKQFPGTRVILKPINDVQNFKDEWDKMGEVDGEKVEIDAVELSFHGSATPNEYGKGIGFLQMPNGSDLVAGMSGGYKKEDLIISSEYLKNKSMKVLYFASCNSGNPDVDNVATAFSKLVSADEIIAWDGGVMYNYDKLIDEKGDSGELIKGYKDMVSDEGGQGTFNKYVNRDTYGIPTRSRQGKVYIKDE